jgi:voltage-gated potassium channel
MTKSRDKEYIKKGKSRRIEVAIAALTVVSLIIILIAYTKHLSQFQIQILYAFDLIVAIILAIDFAFRLKNQPKGHKLKFFMKNWYEVPAMIPLIVYTSFDTHLALGFVLRALRLITFFRLIRLFRLLSYFGESQFLFIALFVSVTIIFGAISIYLVESPITNSDIQSLGDAFWWSIGIVSTIAPNNLTPVTTDGKVIASVLMFISIGIIAILISSLGSRLIHSRITRENKKNSIVKGGALIQEAKDDIKVKIDRIENLNEQEIEFLLNIIKSVRGIILYQEQVERRVANSTSSNNSLEIGFQRQTCLVCNNIYPIDSDFCNHCGARIVKSG